LSIGPWRADATSLTAAATGAIAGAAIVLGRAIVDLPTVAIASATFLVLWRARLVPEPVVILAAGALGLILRKP